MSQMHSISSDCTQLTIKANLFYSTDSVQSSSRSKNGSFYMSSTLSNINYVNYVNENEKTRWNELPLPVRGAR